MVNELFAGLSNKYLMAELDWFTCFASLEQFGMFFKQAVDFLICGKLDALKNPFFGLANDFLYDRNVMSQ